MGLNEKPDSMPESTIKWKQLTPKYSKIWLSQKHQMFAIKSELNTPQIIKDKID